MQIPNTSVVLNLRYHRQEMWVFQLFDQKSMLKIRFHPSCHPPNRRIDCVEEFDRCRPRMTDCLTSQWTIKCKAKQ